MPKPDKLCGINSISVYRKQSNDYFLVRQVIALPWTTKSPDLNPIEHVWARLTRELTDDGINETRLTADELWMRVMAKWEGLRACPDFFTSLASSLPRRIRAVIHAAGGHTAY